MPKRYSDMGMISTSTLTNHNLTKNVTHSISNVHNNSKFGVVNIN